MPMTRSCVTIASLALFAGAAQAHDHGYLISLGHEHSGGGHGNILEIEFEFSIAHTMHDPMFGLPGLSTDMLSFEEIIADPNDPHYHDGIATIAEGSKIRAVFTRFDAGVSAYDPFDLSNHMEAPGATFVVGTGGTNFDRAIIWNLDPSAPGFDAGAGVWTADFYITDAAGIHEDSQVYTMSLKMVPAPGSMLALGAAGLLAGRRRR